jgi:hypothetical protein
MYMKDRKKIVTQVTYKKKKSNIETERNRDKQYL